jgi:hypothetical protein
MIHGAAVLLEPPTAPFYVVIPFVLSTCLTAPRESL